MTTKECTECGKVKPLDKYYKHKGGQHGVRGACKLCISSRNKKHYDTNKNTIIEKQTIYKTNNKEKIKLQRKAHYECNKDHIKSQKKEYYENNKKSIIAKRLIYVNNRRSEDTGYRILGNLRSRLRHALNGINKSCTTKQLLGCTTKELRKHLESQFTDGMSWDNYGYYGWHIDHITPCASFDMSDPEQQRQCFHYTNLQPLWAEDNLRKSDKTL